MSRQVDFRKELFITTIVWVFIVASAGAFFGLKILGSLRKKDSHMAEETADEVKDTSENNSEESAESEQKTEQVSETETAPEGASIAETTTTMGPSPFAGMAQNANGTNSSSTYDAIGHVGEDGLKYVYYKTMVWGTVVADFADFRAKVAETLMDARGWSRMGLRFVEVTDGQDLNIILSDATSLEGYNGYCSGELSCTSGFNEVIINDERWRQGTVETVGGGMSIRDYQNMVVNHEVGHWLGHYSHLEACDADGGVAPIMLQQSTGLRNCGTFNPWPLDSELWTLR